MDEILEESKKHKVLIEKRNKPVAVLMAMEDYEKGEFSGYWRLRVGDYRVVYKISKDEVLVYVINVGIRRDDRVYRELLSRLKQKPN